MLANVTPVTFPQALLLLPATGKQGEVRTLIAALVLSTRDEHVLLVDPNGASWPVTLDPEVRTLAGLQRTITNIGASGEILTIQTDTPTEIDQLDGGESGTYYLDGAVWRRVGGDAAPGAFRTSFSTLEDFTTGGHLDAGKWTLASGSDGAAADAAQHEAIVGGVVELVTGAAGTNVAADGSSAAWLGNPIRLDSAGGDIAIEARIRIATAITGVSINFGLTDSTALEEPFTGSADVLTSVATDAACLVYDDGNTTKEWFGAAVDTDADDAGNAATGSAPVADTWQLLRMEVSSDGATIRYKVDGVLVLTLSGDVGVGDDVVLYPFVIANSTAAASKTVLVDLVQVEGTR